jgi:hypothetical protein
MGVKKKKKKRVFRISHVPEEKKDQAMTTEMNLIFNIY